jgi:hypothetical protein
MRPAGHRRRPRWISPERKVPVQRTTDVQGMMSPDSVKGNDCELWEILEWWVEGLTQSNAGYTLLRWRLPYPIIWCQGFGQNEVPDTSSSNVEIRIVEQ